MVHFVGAGSGAVDLITLRGKNFPLHRGHAAQNRDGKRIEQNQSDHRRQLSGRWVSALYALPSSLRHRVP